uniref:Uncharacterized protein n=1 Tax=Oryza glaberrima TaxID=4538 RepID=I1PYT9_ORYGL
MQVRNPSWAEYVSWAVQWLTAYWAFSRSVAPAGGEEAGGELLLRGRELRVKGWWVLPIKAHHAAGRLTGAAAGSLCSMAPLREAKRWRRRLQWRRPLWRVARPEQIARRIDADGAPGESTALRARSYGCIRVFLVLSLLLLAVEVAAYL